MQSRLKEIHSQKLNDITCPLIDCEHFDNCIVNHPEKIRDKDVYRQHPSISWTNTGFEIVCLELKYA